MEPVSAPAMTRGVALRHFKDALPHVVALLYRKHVYLLSASCNASYHTGPGSGNIYPPLVDQIRSVSG
jgi:hypothetical protein